MSTLFTLLWFVANIVMVVFIIKAIREKDADAKKKNRMVWLICLAVAFISVIVAAVTSDSTTSNDTERITEEQTTEMTEEAETTSEEDEIEALKQELKEKYDISTPSKFPRGDSTGNWRVVTVANATAPAEYAYDYARAYMQDGDVHYIVNFSLNTTTQLKETMGKLSVVTTEYVEDEEHDASLIGGGMLYTEKYYDMSTGKEVTTEGNESAGTVESDDLVAAVKEAIADEIGEGEKITDVTFDGENLTVKVDLSGGDTSRLTPEMLAESRASSITDGILQMDDSYYNTWNTITIDFGSIGNISFKKSDVKDQGFGRYFDVPVGYFE